MTLSDLLVSYNEVRPEVTSDPELDFELPNFFQPVEATASVTDPTPSSNPSQEKAKQGVQWYFANYAGGKPFMGITPLQENSNSFQFTNTNTTPKTSSKTTPLSGNMVERAKYWMNQFSRFGVDQKQSLAIVASMIGECGLDPKGKVEKKELSGNGNTKKGWAHAGEGAIGFTHWSTKKQLIEKYNKDPRRGGPELSTSEAEYAKPSSRHIADLENEDHALLTYLYYKDRLNATKNFSFNDLIGDFYIQKAGVGYRTKWGTKLSMEERAFKAGQEYQKAHKKLGYIKASKTNTFTTTLDNAKSLASQLGISV